MTLVPAKLISILGSVSSDFRAEKADTQFRLALMLWKCMEPRRQHMAWADMVSFTKAEIRRMWGSDERMRRTLAGKHFLALEHASGKYTTAYQPSEEMMEALRLCVHDPSEGDLLDQRGRCLSRFPRAICSTRAGTTTRASAWSRVTPANAVPVDTVSLMRALERATGRAAQVVEALLILARNTIQPGHVPISYLQHRTGRLFAAGLSLQFAPREVRKAALPQCWDYDIATCHHSIAASLASRAEISVPCLRRYVENKVALRTLLAEDCELTIAQVKLALQMVMYGAPVSTSPYASMPLQLGGLVTPPELDSKGNRERAIAVGAAAVRRLRGHSLFQGIALDVRRSRPAIIRMHTERGGWVVNPLGLRVSVTDAAPRVGLLMAMPHSLRAWLITEDK